MASNEQDFVWIDIDITLADAIDAARTKEADVVEMLQNLKAGSYTQPTLPTKRKDEH